MMNNPLLRGRLVVRIHPGSPNLLVNTGYCTPFVCPLCKIMQNFAASVREHVKNTGTKPVQPDSTRTESHRHYKQKNPSSAATETGINSLTKASSFPHPYNISDYFPSSGEVLT